MLTKTAIEHFKTQAEICRVLGISSAAVAKWGEVVPLESALALEIRTNKALQVDRGLYPNLARAIDAASQKQPKQLTA
jgi:hypothetical protein